MKVGKSRGRKEAAVDRVTGPPISLSKLDPSLSLHYYVALWKFSFSDRSGPFTIQVEIPVCLKDLIEKQLQHIGFNLYKCYELVH